MAVIKMIVQNKNHRIIITFISITVLIILSAVGYFSGFFFYSGITPCLPPPNIIVDGAATSRVYTWIDANGNGLIDVGEKALPNVEIISPPAYPHNIVTDNSGSADTYEFRAGCVCKCWEGEYVEVAVPNSYSPTTPVRVELKSYDPLVTFGFITRIP